MFQFHLCLTGGGSLSYALISVPEMLMYLWKCECLTAQRVVLSLLSSKGRMK